jgi:hypothetical protein
MFMLIYWQWSALFLSPALPLAFSWTRILKTHPIRLSQKWTAPIVATASLGWLTFGLAYPGVLGPDYSQMRGEILACNFLGTLLIAALALLYSPIRQIWASIASLMLSCVWLFILAINSVV